MAVVIQSFDYPPRDGGIARLCGAVARCFEDRGYDIRVISQRHEGVRTVPVPVGEFRVRRARPLREFEAYARIRIRHRCDLVISGIWYPEGLLAGIARAERSVIMAHGLELMPGASRFRQSVWASLRRRVLESADLVVANSRYTAGLVSDAAPRASVIPLPLGVDHRFFVPGDRIAARRRFSVDDRIVISSVSRLHDYKGHDTVLDALSMLPPGVLSRFVYLIAGKGPARARLEVKAEKLNLTPAIRWLGYVPDDALPSLYNASHLFVLCTRENPLAREVEGFGLVFLEAQACGTPVVGASTGGIPDAIKEGSGGWLIAPDDPSALSALLLRLADRPEEFQLAGKAARARVERECTWSCYFERLVGALESHGLVRDSDRMGILQHA